MPFAALFKILSTSNHPNFDSTPTLTPTLTTPHDQSPSPMWPLSLTLQKKKVLAEVDIEPIPRECRICLGGDEEGEEWVAPCHCPHDFVWVHRSCIEWRLKHTRIDEDKLRCAVCK